MFISKKKYEASIESVRESAYNEARSINKTDVKAAACTSAVGAGVVVSAILGFTMGRKIKNLEKNCIIAEEAVNKSFSRLVTLTYSDDEEVKEAVRQDVRRLIDASNNIPNKDAYITSNIQMTVNDLFNKTSNTEGLLKKKY